MKTGFVGAAVGAASPTIAIKTLAMCRLRSTIAHLK